ncbi:MAG: Ppx/GppA family phosphatase, partial [Sphingobium sp.]
MVRKVSTRPAHAVSGGAPERAALPPNGVLRSPGKSFGDHSPFPRSNYAAIDLGTNNCRLLIARPEGEGGFVVVDAFSRIVRLGEGLGVTGRLSEAAWTA